MARAASPDRVSRFIHLVLLVATLVPPVLITVKVAQYGLNVPFWDEWNLVPLLRKALEGHLRLEDLWAPHNQHRFVLPWTVLLVLARATGWDIRYEMAANIVAALGTLVVLAVLIRRTVRPVAPSLTPWLVLTVSLLTFSLTQYANWLWGMQLLAFMIALAAVVTIWALARWGQQGPGPAVFGHRDPPRPRRQGARRSLDVAHGAVA